MDPVLVGFFPQKTRLRQGQGAIGVEEICCLRGCGTQGPQGWFGHWKHNDLFLFNSPASAWNVVEDSQKKQYDLLAYKLFPLSIFGGEALPVEIPALSVEPLNGGFEKLGYSVESRSERNESKCSPQVNDAKLGKCRVNRYCLMDEAKTALDYALSLKRKGCEPGPYCVMEVWRQKRSPRG